MLRKKTEDRDKDSGSDPTHFGEDNRETALTESDCIALLKKYSTNSKALDILVSHSRHVMEKATAIAKRLDDQAVDIPFIKEGAWLHDIGIVKTSSPDIACTGKHPYIAHGILGRDILEKEGLLKHALVCERHTGTGLTISDIESQRLPLPERSMTPLSVEEQIICYADKFYSKSPKNIHIEKSIESIRLEIARFASSKTQTFDAWVRKFGP